MAEGEQDDTQKTEEPTQKRIEEARKKGQVAISREVNNWIMLLAATILIGTAAPGLMKNLQHHMRAYIEHAHDMPQVPGGFSIILGDSFWVVIGFLALPLIVLMAAAFLGPFLQVGPLFAPEIIKMDLSKVSPMAGMKRLFSLKALMEFVKGLMKLALVTFVGLILIRPYFGQIEHMVGLPIPLILSEMQTLT
ncbi:MAG TPA: EscU/YscU/HrcU family type III secretion system export apparatus switch protein, partial [Alphaproteobacteria bacterium]